jgi:16S rRNA (cytosine967-C5)-methyltransferase
MTPRRPPRPNRPAAPAPQAEGEHVDGMRARQAAMRLVQAALERRSGFEEACADRAFTALDPRDRGFARALALATLRRLGAIDAMLAARMERTPPLAVSQLLRIGLAQMLAMDTPDFAAVSSTVMLAEREQATRPYKGLINAVLRGLARDPITPDPATYAPPWLMARWRASYGDETATAIAASIPHEPPTDLSLRGDADATALAVELEGELLPGGSLRTPRRGDVAEWPRFDDGSWWVQDAAAAVPGRLLAPRAGEAILDLCAAPGGKTLQLAATGATVTAVDRSASRLRRLKANLERTGLAAEVVVADGEKWQDEREFDAVLLDAPCSATGTFRRHPDVLWASRPGDVSKLADVQHRLLDAAARRVRPGGRLVYCVCTLEREEGEGQIQAFLRRTAGFHLDAADPTAVGAPAEAASSEGWLRILPSHWAEKGGLDGFFVARMTREG